MAMNRLAEADDAPRACRLCSVRNRSLCAVLSSQDLAALNALSRHRTYGPGRVIALDGAEPVFGTVLSGTIVESKSLPDGREQIVSLLFPADFVGTTAEGLADATAVAVGEVKLCMFDRKDFEGALKSFPALNKAVFAHARHELAEARAWMLLLGQKSASERVATFLLRLATREARAGCSWHVYSDAVDGLEFEVPISRAQIASYLGITTETVSRRLSALQQAGAIALRGVRAVRIVDGQALRAAASSA